MSSPSRSIAYLCSAVTISGSPDRRVDAYEHDYMMAALTPAFAERGMTVVEVRWDDATVDWSSFDAAIIGTTWDYWDRCDEYLATLAVIASRTLLMNDVSLVRWNIDKRYLRELQDKGAPTIPTVWLDEATPVAIEAAFDALGCDDLVVKRQIGASSDGQHRLTRGTPPPELTEPMMAQPFQSAILTEGEYSMLFVDGEFSHAVVKRATSGDYRIQSEYGGTEFDHTPSAEDLEAANHVLSLLDNVPLYARVDMLRDLTGQLQLMELELIEPYLYPEQGPSLGPLLAAAVERRLA